MIKDIEKIEKARLIIQKIADGTNPINGQPVEADSFLHDSRIIRCFYFISEVLEAVVKGTYSNKKINDFVITDEQKNKVVFTEGNIGVNEAARCINLQLNPLMSKKVTGALLNKGLKRLGILSEAVEDGKKRTVTNEISKDYGFFSEKRSYDGREYDMVLINNEGKKYILDNIEKSMKLFGADINYYPLQEKNSFKIKEDILNYINEKTKIVFICNPNNPTGQLTDKNILEKIILKLKEEKAFLAVDECFLDFVENSEEYSTVDLINKYDNLIVIKAFTKTFAIPGIRLGYCMSLNEELINNLKSMGPPWNVSTIAQAAGIAALKEFSDLILLHNYEDVNNLPLVMNNIFALYDDVIYLRNLIVTINYDGLSIKKNLIQCNFNVITAIDKDFINHSINYDMILSVDNQTLVINIPLHTYKDETIGEFYYLDNNEYELKTYTGLKGIKRNLIPIRINDKIYIDNIKSIVRKILEEGFGCSEKQVVTL